MVDLKFRGRRELTRGNTGHERFSCVYEHILRFAAAAVAVTLLMMDSILGGFLWNSKEVFGG